MLPLPRAPRFLIGLRTLDGPRRLGVAAGVLLAIAVYVSRGRMHVVWQRAAAAGLAATMVLGSRCRWNADGPFAACPGAAVAFALRYRDEPRLRTAVWMGLAAGGACSIKASSVRALAIGRSLSCGAGRSVHRDPSSGGDGVAVYGGGGAAVALLCGSSRTPTTNRAATHGGAFRKVLDTLDRDKLARPRPDHVRRALRRAPPRRNSRLPDQEREQHDHPQHQEPDHDGQCPVASLFRRGGARRSARTNVIRASASATSTSLSRSHSVSRTLRKAPHGSRRCRESWW